MKNKNEDTTTDLAILVVSILCLYLLRYNIEIARFAQIPEVIIQPLSLAWRIFFSIMIVIAAINVLRRTISK